MPRSPTTFPARSRGGTRRASPTWGGAAPPSSSSTHGPSSILPSSRPHSSAGIVFRPLAGAASALERLRQAGLVLACVSNWDMSLDGPPRACGAGRSLHRDRQLGGSGSGEAGSRRLRRRARAAWCRSPSARSTSVTETATGREPRQPGLPSSRCRSLRSRNGSDWAADHEQAQAGPVNTRDPHAAAAGGLRRAPGRPDRGVHDLLLRAGGRARPPSSPRRSTASPTPGFATRRSRS